MALDKVAGVCTRERVLLIMVAIWIFLASVGCAVVDPVVAGYDQYTRVQSVVDSDDVIAMLSYSAADVSNSDLFAPADFELFFSNQYATIEASGVIHSNYPVEAGSDELGVCREFTDAWLVSARSMRGGQARQDYVVSVSELITRISDAEYNPR